VRLISIIGLAGRVGLFKGLRDRLKGVSKKLEDEVERQLGEQVERELAEAIAQPAPAPATPRSAEPPISPAAATAKAESRDVPLAGASRAAELDEKPLTPTPPIPPTPKLHPPPAETAASRPRPSAPAAPQAPQRITGRKALSEEEIGARLERELQEAVAVQKEVEKTVATAAPTASRFTINEQVLEDVLWDLEVGLLESDVALPVIEAIKASVKEQLLTMSVGGKAEEIVEQVLKMAIQRVLSVNPLDFDAFVRERIQSGKKPLVVMFVGVNGTGKTTSIARIAHRLKSQGISSVMAAGDTFRAGAIEQLALHGERLGITVIKQGPGADPAAVAFDAVEHARARHKDVVLLDTAGRMQNNRSLMDEMDKIRRVANPDLTIFVGDSLAGNDAVEQARRFDQVVDIGGIILTKVDVDAKGGAALSVAYTIHKPLLFVGVGQNYPDLRPFDAKWMVDRIFGDEA
jgi:fused signal recognition particle receptor